MDSVTPSPMTLVWPYDNAAIGTLIRRYKRFLAEVALTDGAIVTAHCPNTGPMTGVCKPGSPVLLLPSTNPHRKLAYTWEAIAVEGVWVGVNTARPNAVVKVLLDRRLLPALEPWERWRAEVPYGQENSRIDFLLEGEKPLYLEVKNTTWCEGSLALFPDTVTERGQKHLREAIALAQRGIRAAVLYFVHRGDGTAFAPGAAADSEYARLWAVARAAGVQMLACGMRVSPQGIAFQGMLPCYTGADSQPN